MKISTLLLIYFFVGPCAADIQFQAGTLVAYELTPEKFFIAADSRGLVPGKPPDDKSCKIAAFKSHNLVFAEVGVAAAGIVGRQSKGDPRVWDAISEAKHALDSSPPVGEGPDALPKYIGGIVSTWTDNMTAIWENMQRINPDRVSETAARNKSGLLTTGIFAFAHDHVIVLGVRGIYLRNGRFGIDAPATIACAGSPCVSGHDEVFRKYDRSGRDYMIGASFPKSYPPELSRVVRLVDLTIAEDESGTVHGPVDALELSADGSIQWRQRKDNCAEDSDLIATAVR